MSRRARQVPPLHEKRISCKEAAALLGVNVGWRTITDWAREGVLANGSGRVRLESQKIGGRVYTTPESIRRFLLRTNKPRKASGHAERECDNPKVAIGPVGKCDHD